MDRAGQLLPVRNLEGSQILAGGKRSATTGSMTRARFDPGGVAAMAVEPTIGAGGLQGDFPVAEVATLPTPLKRRVGTLASSATLRSNQQSGVEI